MPPEQAVETTNDALLRWANVAPGVIVVAIAIGIIFVHWRYILKPAMEFAVRLRNRDDATKGD